MPEMENKAKNKTTKEKNDNSDIVISYVPENVIEDSTLEIMRNNGVFVRRRKMITNRKSPEYIAEDCKDDRYWMKRVKNNEAAKRSRERQKVNSMALQMRIVELLEENETMKAKIERLEKERGKKSTDGQVKNEPTNDGPAREGVEMNLAEQRQISPYYGVPIAPVPVNPYALPIDLTKRPRPLEPTFPGHYNIAENYSERERYAYEAYMFGRDRVPPTMPHPYMPSFHHYPSYMYNTKHGYDETPPPPPPVQTRHPVHDITTKQIKRKRDQSSDVKVTKYSSVHVKESTYEIETSPSSRESHREKETPRREKRKVAASTSVPSEKRSKSDETKQTSSSFSGSDGETSQLPCKLRYKRQRDNFSSGSGSESERHDSNDEDTIDVVM